MNTLLVVLGLAGFALLFIFLLREARRLGWILALAGLGVAGLVAYALVAQATATRQVAQVAQVQATTSAATTLTLFLVVLILLLVLAIISTFAAFQWWQKRQEQRRFMEIVQALQIQALLNSRMPAGVPGQTPSTPIIIVPQAPQVPWALPPGQIVMLPEDQEGHPANLFHW